MKRFSIFVAVALASNPAHALDLKKELERLRGGADDKGTQTHATPAAAVGRTAPVAAASLRGRAAPADASRLAPQASRLGAIVKPTDPDAFECNPFKHKRQLRLRGSEGADVLRRPRLRSATVPAELPYYSGLKTISVRVMCLVASSRRFSLAKKTRFKVLTNRQKKNSSRPPHLRFPHFIQRIGANASNRKRAA